MKNYKILLVFLVNLILLGNFSAQGLIASKVGIMLKSGEKISNLRAKDRIKTGDELRIYIEPLQKSYIYAVYSDEKEAVLLNSNDNLAKDDILVIPSNEEFIKIDSENDRINFSVICSEKRIKELENLFNSHKTTSTNWEVVYNKLVEITKKDISETSEKPVTIAGNVRGEEVDFTKSLRKFSGEGIIIRNYEVTVKK